VRWFGGCVMDDSEMPVHVPSGARLLWAAPFPVWVVGVWPTHEVTIHVEHDRSIAVLGPHQVAVGELSAFLGQRARVPPWPGCYTVVICDPNGVTVFTDPAHACPVYTLSPSGGMVWGSSSRALADLAGYEVDVAWIAAAVVSPAVSGLPGRSAFANVASVAAGHRLYMAPGRAPELVRWWTIPDRVPREQAALRVRSGLEAAVALRMAEALRVSADCSGGLDSTSLCLLAAHQAKPAQQVSAITVCPAGVAAGGDLDHARLAVAGREGLEHVVLPLSSRHQPYAELHMVPAVDEPAPTTITYVRHRHAYDVIASLGSVAHLSGDGGDTLFMQRPAYLLELARTGRLWRVMRDVQGWARLRHLSPWRWARDQVSALRTPYGQAPNWVTSRALELVKEATLGQVKEPGSVTDVGLLAELRSVARTAHADVQLAEHHGVQLHNPFFDRVVLDAALSVGVADRGSPWEYKPIIRAAMTDMLPPTVAQRGAKGTTMADHHHGLRAHLTEVLELADGNLAVLGLIDVKRFRATVRQAAYGLPIEFGDFEPALTAEIWLRSLATQVPQHWDCRSIEVRT